MDNGKLMTNLDQHYRSTKLKQSLGVPDDYLFWIIPHRPDMFHPNRHRSTELELLYNIDEFNYYYADELESEKRAVAVVCKLLSPTLWKKASIMRMDHFMKEFGLPERLDQLLLRHPEIFYVSNRYKIDTVVLQDGYRGTELVDKDSLVVVKEKFGELMQEGLYEYNRRKQLVDLEEKRMRRRCSSKCLRGLVLNEVTYNALICGYTKQGRIGDVRRVMRLMEVNGCRPNTWTYTSMNCYGADSC